MDIFANLLLGHLTGDYLLQSKKMALKKSEKSWTGFWWCFGHCLIYTLSMCLWLWTAQPLIILATFISHFPIDRWSLAAQWLKLIHGRSFMAAGDSIDLSFSCLVYAVVDNIMHLIILRCLLWLLY